MCEDEEERTEDRKYREYIKPKCAKTEEEIIEEKIEKEKREIRELKKK